MISVIIPVYNVSPFLCRCLDSVRKQEYIREILLVDDGSTDDSGEICDRYAKLDPRITVIHKENGGLSSARNTGLDRAAGKYIAFVDSDDYLEPNAYRCLVQAAEKNDADLVCAGRFDLDGSTGEKQTGLCPQKEELLDGIELCRRIFTWDHVDSAAWDKLYRRELFEGIRYPEGMICEDVPVTYRLALRAKRIAMVPQALYNYYHRPGSITTSRVSPKSFHLSVHAQEICQDLAARCPELQPQAKALWAWSLAHPMMLCQEYRQVSELKEPYRQCRRSLCRLVPFFLSSPLVSKKQKGQYLLLVLGLFGPVWHIHCILHPADRTIL